MVHDDQQPPTARRGFEPHHLHHLARGRVETILGRVELGADGVGEGVCAGRRVDPDAPDQPLGVHRTCRRHDHAVLAGTDPGPEHVVPIQDRLHCTGERGVVEPLRRGQQRRLREPVVVSAAVEQPMGDGQQWHVPDAAAVEFGQGGGVRPALRHPGERLDRLVFEHVPGCEVQSRSLRPRHQLDRHDRIAAQPEERVVDAHRVQPQDLGEEVGQLSFAFGPRSASRRAGAEVGRGQCPPVQLARRTERERVEHHHRGRNHVRREERADELGDVGGVDRGAGFGHHVPDESARRPGSVDRDDGTRHPREPAQGGLDLAELDAEAADLDLEVGAAQVLQLSGAVPSDQVAGAVHAAARVPERVRDEAFPGGTGTGVIATRQAAAENVQLPRHAGRHRMQPRIEHHERRAQRGTSDRDRDSHRERFADARDDGGLGRPVRVEHPTARRPLRHQFGRARLASGGDALERRQTGGVHRGERGRRDERVRDAVFAQQVPQLVAAEDRGRRDDHRGARAHRE